MASSSRPKTPQKTKVQDVLEEPVLCLDVANQNFEGPKEGKGHYASISILDPIVTIERHGRKYHIAARFNIETTILYYNTKKRDGHELYFHDICLQYMREWGHEELVMKPESDPAASFAVTRSSNTTISGETGVSLSQAPSANVSLGLSRSTGLTVEYVASTWTVSAHHIVSRGADKDSKRKDRMKHLKGKAGEKPSNHSHRSRGQREARYQWFWAGTQEETRKLTSDLKHTVKRHIVVKRVIPLEEFPLRRVITARAKEVAEKGWIDSHDRHDTMQPAITEATNARRAAKSADRIQHPSLEDLLRFDFYIQIRVKRRYGRLHRAFLLTTNSVKAALLEPTYKQAFFLRPKLGSNEVNIPLADTADIAVILDEVKKKTDSKWEELQGKRLVTFQDYKNLFSQENSLSERRGIASNHEKVVNQTRTQYFQPQAFQPQAFQPQAFQPQDFNLRHENLYRDERLHRPSFTRKPTKVHGTIKYS